MDHKIQDKKGITCLRCGTCCHFTLPDGSKQKCKYLVMMGNKSSCRIYGSRLGRVVYKNRTHNMKVICTARINVKKEYPGCPYNNEVKE